MMLKINVVKVILKRQRADSVTYDDIQSMRILLKLAKDKSEIVRLLPSTLPKIKNFA